MRKQADVVVATLWFIDVLPIHSAVPTNESSSLIYELFISPEHNLKIMTKSLPSNQPQPCYNSNESIVEPENSS